MKLAGKIQVESLDEERWTNIERAVVSGAAEAASKHQVRASRWGMALAFGAAMVVVVIAAGLIGWKVRGPGGATVAETQPLVVDTSERAARIDIGDARIESDPATAFVVTRPDGGVLVAMERGKVELTVDKRGNRAPLVVRAGDTDVVVVGTRFSVDYGDGKGGVEVVVTEGVVNVVRASKEVRVAANQTWTTAGGLVETQVAIADSSRGTPNGSPTGSANGGGMAGGSNSTNADGTSATDGPTADAAGKPGDPAGTGSAGFEVQLGDGPDVLKDRQSAVPDAKLSTSGTGSAGSTKPKVPTGGPELRTRPKEGATNEPASDLKSLIRAQTVLPPLDLKTLDPTYLDKINKQWSGTPENAVSTYRIIAATEKGELASKAFYSIAHVQFFRLQRTSDALSTIDGYQRRFSGGKEHAAALWLRVRILCLQKIDDRCRQAAYNYKYQTDQDAKRNPARNVAEAIVEQR